MRTWVSVITQGDCGLAEIVTHEHSDLRSFLVSWQRPINLKAPEDQIIVDARTNGNIIYLLDFLKLYDWRGDKTNQGYMYDGHYWFWGYYNVKSISIDLRSNIVETKLNASSSWVKLNTVTSQLRLWPLGAYMPGAKTWSVDNGDFPDLTDYCDPDREAAIEQIMGVTPRDESKLANFGGFYYENVSGNVTEFDVHFPVTIGYEWGEMTEWVVWHINTTAGH